MYKYVSDISFNDNVMVLASLISRDYRLTDHECQMILKALKLLQPKHICKHGTICLAGEEKTYTIFTNSAPMTDDPLYLRATNYTGLYSFIRFCGRPTIYITAVGVCLILTYKMFNK